jgi:hypothetical protein
MSSRSYFKSSVIKLEPRDGVRALELRLPPGVDRIYLLRSTADISKINISVDGGDLISLSDFLPAEILPPPERIFLYWEPSEDNKEIQFLFGREYYRRAVQYVVVMRDFDLKPDTELIASTSRYHVANDYNLLNIDLSTARTDALIADRVVALSVVGASPGAQYSLKLFSPDKPAIDHTIAKVGFTLERLALANVYLSNPALVNEYVKLLVLRWVS